MITIKNVKIIKNIDHYIFDNNIKTIIDNTVETWQPKRSSVMKTNDTKLGKLAEEIVTGYIKLNIPNISYLSYDNFRTNNFKKHAPFDGLIFSNEIDINILKALTIEINQEITADDFGKISDKLKSKCLKNKVFLAEIKSTRVTSRHKKSDGNVMIETILKDDFLEYPKFIRVDINNDINSFSDYINFVKENRGFKCAREYSCEEDIKLEEKMNMRHIYIRVYIDEITNIAYIVGCISMKNFVNTMILKKMKQFNKSELALYLSTPLKNGVDIDSLLKI
jgi:hypothetical protein